jgi:sec-independent protein translocase protein TatA
MWEAPWHWVVLAMVVIALFGYQRLPDASRALGRSLRIFRSEIKGMAADNGGHDAGGSSREAEIPQAAMTEVDEATPATPSELLQVRPEGSGVA